MKATFVPTAFLSALSFLTLDARALDRQVSVSGTCTRSVVPDRASILVTAEAKDANPKKAMTEATALYERVRTKVLNLTLKDRELATSEVSLNEEKVWEKDRLVSKGFVARMGLRVESSEAASLGDVSRIAAEAGIKEIGALASFLSSTKQRVETEACLKDAVRSAQRKAGEMAEAAGAKLGEVVSLSESSSFQPMPVRPMARSSMMMKGGAEMADAASPTIEAGKQELSTQVQATFLLR